MESQTPIQGQINSHTAVPPKKKSGPGCFFYGCLTVVVVIILALVGIYFAVKGVVTSYTESTPIKLAEVTVSSNEVAEVQERIESFKNAIKVPGNAATLSLTDRDINSLIVSDPNFAEFKDAIRVKIVGDQIGGQVSLDLTPFGFSGRYLNGDATFNVSLTNQHLVVTLRSLQVNGNAVPAQVLSQLANKNLAEEFNADPENKKKLEKFESIEVKNGVLSVRVKG